MQDSWISLVRAPRRQIVEDLALVLASEGVPYEVHARGDWVLIVPLWRFGDAAAALAAFEAEQLPAPSAELDEEGGFTLVGVAVGVALMTFHLLLGLIDGDGRWLSLGRASYTRVLSGELWRSITALTLHSGPFHVASNAVALALFGGFLGRIAGNGVTLWLLLLSGAIGHLLNLLWRGVPHLSIGASTAVFGAVGALAGLQARRYRERPALARRAWIPLAGGVALLAMLGSSPDSDFGAHLAGLMVGSLIGISLPLVMRRPLPQRPQTMLAVAAVATIALAWWAAWSAATTPQTFGRS